MPIVSDDDARSASPVFQPRWFALLGAAVLGLGLVIAFMLILAVSVPAQAELGQDSPVTSPEAIKNEEPTGQTAVAGVSASTAVTFTLAWSALETDHSSSVAWGDWEGDGDLDLAVGNVDEPIRVYANIGNALELAWSSSEIARTSSVAWGDWDNDGDLDLTAGNTDQQNRVYRNTGGSLQIAWYAPINQNTQSVAWGDMDGDGDLDLAVGNTGEPNRVYRNTGGGMEVVWEATEAMTTTSVAWGKLDPNETLDLAVANNGQPIQVFTNTGVYTNTSAAFLLAWTAPFTETTKSIAWGNCDDQGGLDLAVGNSTDPNRVYTHTDSTLFPAWQSDGWNYTNSVVWGDVNGDGQLDLVHGNLGPIEALINHNCDFTVEPITQGFAWADSIALGDWDVDGDLDLAVGSPHYFSGIPPNRVYANTGQRLWSTWESPEIDHTMSVAWGDMNGDGHIDLAVGNSDEPNRVYTNTGGGLQIAWNEPTTVTATSKSVAWGDWDEDGDLDLAVGNHDDNAPNYVYTNISGTLEDPWAILGPDVHTESVAWGDMDGDSDLDLAIGGIDQRIEVYSNLGGSLERHWRSLESPRSQSLAWGDWDGDGDLDLAAANTTGPIRVYANQTGMFELAWTAPFTESSHSVAWADWDSDGDLDLAVGNYHVASRVYENIGGSMEPAWLSPETSATVSVAWADWDGDGDPDLAFANEGFGSIVYASTGDTLKRAWSADTGVSNSVAWADWDNDGDLDIVFGNMQGPSRVFANRSADNPGLSDTSSTAFIPYPAGATVMFYGSATIRSGPTVPVSYLLKDSESHPVRLVKAFYSLDGGSTWQPAVAASGTITRNLTTSPAGVEHTYIWDVYASNVFGASDNAVFRLDVYQGFNGAGPYQYAFRTARSLPFRLRGSQIRTMNDAAPAANAQVYRLPAGQTGAFQPYRDGLGRPFQTNPAGYLRGYGDIGLGDRLVALAPISATESYTLYYTNVTPTASGVDPYTVSALGVQTLTVSSANALVLFNLDVSLEWDARNDAPFLAQLEHDIHRASELLYDWSNGQVALGKVTVFHAKQHWQDAHVLIYANNRFRPAATEGGIVTDTLTETISAPITATSVITYLPGQVAMGPVWNRYGDPGSNLGEDWPRAFAHEVAHFALFLDDNYIGLDNHNLLMPVDTCPGAMADPYRDDDASGYGEFHPAAGWLPGCANTLSNRNTGRADWHTVGEFYPWLSTAITNAGPTVLPLAVTEVQVVEPITPTTALPAPLFLLVQNGNRVLPDARARSYLFQDGWAIDLGQPSQDRLLARGARPGDRLCVYDLGASRLGCETITVGDTELTLVAVSGWPPEVTVTPITTRTLAISLTSVPPGQVLYAKLYPLDEPSQGEIGLTEMGGAYLGTFVLDDPSLVGVIQVWWIDGTGQRREIVTDYVLGGNPGRIWSGGGRIWSGGVRIWSGGGRIWSGGAPVGSADGQVMVYNPDDRYSQEWFLTVQASSATPPPWATLVGKAYRVAASGAAPDLTAMSIAFSYLGSDVPPGEEPWLRVYYLEGTTWRQLATRLDTTNNMATARVHDPASGVYALMSSIEIPFDYPGWNMFGYPILTTRPVTEALISISGYYTTVQGWDPGQPDPYQRWRTYDTGFPRPLTTLDVLEFGQGYWINLTQAVVLRLKGADQVLESSPELRMPPATYFGRLAAGMGFTPTVGMTVTAWIDGRLCGLSHAQDVNGQLMVAVNVFANGSGAAAGCGMPGSAVDFRAGETRVTPGVTWDNSQTRQLVFQHCPDFNGSGAVDVADIAAVAERWGQQAGDPGWQAQYDWDGDDDVDVADIQQVATTWPRSCP